MKVKGLNERDIYPSDEVIQDFLGEVFDVWKELETQLYQDKFAISFEWFYIAKKKLWQCQVRHWQTPVFWLSVWMGFFKIQFNFTEKELKAILEMDVSEQIKKDISRSKPKGKTCRVFLKIKKHEQLDDVLKIVKAKKQA